MSDDKAKCVANVCSCPNGIAPSGEKCPIDGAKKCASCNSGFRLGQDQTACDGTRGDYQLHGIVVESNNSDLTDSLELTACILFKGNIFFLLFVKFVVVVLTSRTAGAHC